METSTLMALKKLSDKQAVLATKQIEGKSKKVGTAYFLCLLGFFNVGGLHWFYLRRYGFGTVYICTLGLFYFGSFIDLFMLPKHVEEYNKKVEEEVINTFLMMEDIVDED